MNNRFKTYVRVDTNNLPVNGTNVTRLKKPKVGRWIEIPSTSCCAPFTTIIATPTAVVGGKATVLITCGAGEVQAIATDNFTDINTLVSALNFQLGYLGEFQVVGATIQLNLEGNIASTLCSTGSYTMTITATATPVITSAATASGTHNVAFTYTITASNTPTSFNATGLPAGLTVNTTTGVISGTPTVAATTVVVISATNIAGTGTENLTLTIA